MPDMLSTQGALNALAGTAGLGAQGAANALLSRIPGRRVAVASNASDQTIGQTAGTALTNVSVSVDTYGLPVQVKVTLPQVSASVGGPTLIAQITKDGSVVYQAALGLPTAAIQSGFEFTYQPSVAPTAGSHTWAVVIAQLTASTNVLFSANSGTSAATIAVYLA